MAIRDANIEEAVWLIVTEKPKATETGCFKITFISKVYKLWPSIKKYFLKRKIINHFFTFAQIVINPLFFIYCIVATDSIKDK